MRIEGGRGAAATGACTSVGAAGRIPQSIEHPQPGRREGGWWMMNALLAAAIATATPSPDAAPQPLSEDASPAMFVVRDADTTVYIFGTFHALDGKTDWFKDRVRTA